MEYRTYKLLARRRAPGIPEVMYKGHEGPFRIIAMDLLGPSIEDLLTYCNRHLSLKTVMMISMQMVRLVEVVHRTGFIHRDIKPENFVMGMQAKANIVYMIDFGLAKQYCDPKTGSHICFKMDKGFIGTARYSSIASHLGHEQARRDDMEALCYLFAYLGNGSLPWQGVAAPDRQHRKRIIQEKKVTLPVDDIMGKLPRCYHSMLKTLKSLAFEAKPNYDLYITWLEDEFRARNFEKDFNYDWFEHAEKINSYNTNA
ncbi:Casein kinase I [Diplonema papillatum]|nr:Casein kinase I [Diplonema papillatum]